jgi:hypothetical protein
MNDHPMSDRQVDWGADADVVPPPDAAFDAWIERVAPTLNAPPGKGTPRLEMWAAIQAARRTAGDPAPRRAPRTPWRLMSLIAAALLVGVAIDRLVLPRADAPAVQVAATSGSAGSTDPSRLYRLAATQTLTQAEALLTAYRASTAPQRDSATARQLATWGRQVLGSTRLLIDSPAGADPQLRALLNDLELVLVQIIQLSGARLDASERTLVDRALEDRDLLSRIRTAVPAGLHGAASDD